MSSIRRVDPRIRALGKARIDVTRRAKDEQDWQRQWREPRYPFPFSWSQDWKQSIQYIVDDYAAEIGFWIDVIGLSVCAFSPSYAMFTSPAQDFAFSVVAALDGQLSTPPDTLRIQFMIDDLINAAEELERRGVIFEQKPQPDGIPGSALYTSCFRTPHGICVDLLGAVGVDHPDYRQPEADDAYALDLEEDPSFFDFPEEARGSSETETGLAQVFPQAEARVKEEDEDWPARSPWLEDPLSSGAPSGAGLEEIEEADPVEEDAPPPTEEGREEDALNFGGFEGDSGSQAREKDPERPDQQRRTDFVRPNEIFSRMSPFGQAEDPIRNGAARRPGRTRWNRPWPGKDQPARPTGSQRGQQRSPSPSPRPNGSIPYGQNGGSKPSPQPGTSRRSEEKQHEFPFPLPGEEEDELRYEDLDDLEGMDDSGDLYP